jgi:competence CoiA-like predicted nuclease
MIVNTAQNAETRLSTKVLKQRTKEYKDKGFDCWFSSE